MNSGAVDLDAHQQLGSVSHDVPLASIDPFTRVKSRNSPFRCFHTLAVDNPRHRLVLPPLCQAHFFNKLAVDLIEQAIIAPGLEIPRTVKTGGKSLGNMRHWYREVAIIRIALNTVLSDGS